MHGRSWCRLAGAVMLPAFAIRLYAQTPVPVPGPPDLFVTKLQGATTGTTTSPQGVPQGPAGLPPLPVTELDDRLRTADLDGPRRISLTILRIRCKFTTNVKQPNDRAMLARRLRHRLIRLVLLVLRVH